MKTWTLIDKAFALKRTLLFSELDLDLLLAIGDKLSVSRFKPQETIFPISQEAHRSYLLVEGIVDILGSDNQLITQLYPGEFLGDESLFNDRPRAYSAIAHGECTVLTLSQTHLLNVISECPSVALGVIRAYAAGVDFRTRRTAP